MAKFLLSGDEGIESLDSRPTQVEIKERGEGLYTLRREDGSAVKVFTVRRNQKGNLQVAATTPEGLDGVTTLHLQRIVKALTTAAKYWPAKLGDVKRVEREIAHRDELLTEARS